LSQQIEENQPVSSDDTSSKTELDPQDVKVVKMVERLFKEAKRFRAKYDQDWVEKYRFLRGDQWKQKRPSYRHSEVINLAHAAVQTIVPIMTDSRPNITALPQDPTDFEFSEIVSDILTAKWDKDAYAFTLAECIIDAATYGTAVGECTWDPEKFDGLGDYYFGSVDPFECFPNPLCQDINGKNFRYFIRAELQDVETVKRKHPDQAHLIKADVSEIQTAYLERIEPHDLKIRSAIDSYTVLDSDARHDESLPPTVMVLTCWLTDEATEEVEIDQEVEEKGEDGKTYKKVVKAYQKKKKYPRGRKIKIANGVLLENDHNPYLDSKAPYAKFVDHINPREFWGSGELDQLMGPNRLVNTVMSYILDVMVLMGNPVWLNPTNSGVPSNNLVNVPGMVVDHFPEGVPRRMEGVQLQPFILQTYDRLVDVFDKLSGVHDVSQGALPSAGMSGQAINRLQEAAQTKIRQKTRNMEVFLKKIGQMMLSRILQFYSTPRIIRITNNESAIKYFKFYVEDEFDKSGLVQEQIRAVIQQIEVNPVTGETILGEEKTIDIKGDLDVEIDVGSTLPIAKAAREATADKLIQLGIIDEEDYLDNVEFPNKEKILNKLMKRKEQAAAQAQAEAMAGQTQQQPQSEGA
jgi:hypothetical protein